MAAQSEQESEEQSSNTQVEQSPAAVEMPAPIAALDVNAEMKEKLIAAVKKEVKQLMEEAVTRKFVHEDSGGVTALCAAVEACLGQGLRRRALGLFKTSSTTALLHKIAKHCPEAANVSRRVLAAGAAGEGSGRSASGICTSSAPAPEAARSNSAPPPLSKRGSAGGLLAGVTSGPPQPPQPRYLWIRLALFERQLARIIAHLAANAPRYYERDSLVADPDCGSILASLLVGPCALDFSRAKTPAHYWSDPPADELVQRHRISAGTTTPPSCRRPILNFRRSLNASSDDGISMGNSNVTGGVASSGNTASVAHCAKDYVESLHQNSRATLLYGKNNVLVQPKDVPSPMAGYLSLHQAAPGLTIKWTPNQLMNGYAESETVDKSMCGRRLSCPVVVDTYHCKYSKVFYTVDENSSRRHSLGSQCINCLYWNYALNVSLDEVVYVHCHQGAGAEGAEEGGGGSVILVGQDGVQHPPIHFPKGGHLLAFLSCLETGLLPHGQLDPPLWSQRGQGKVFPRGKIGRRRPMPSVRESSGDSLESPAQTLEPSADYVFRIVSSHPHHQEFVNRHSLLERGSPRQSPLSPRPPRGALASASTTSSDSSTMSVDGHLSGQEGPTTPQMLPATQVTQVASIALVCSTMRRQIISRAFYGWLAYCRHLSTVRTHLSGLVHPTIIPKEGAEGGLTEERWRQLTDEDGAVTDVEEVQRLTYYGGVQHEIRKEVWPYLLGYYDYGSTTASRLEQDATCRRVYETTMSEWLCVEAIVRQRDREAQAASIAKLSEGSGGSAHANGANGDANLNNEVFEDNCSILSDDPPVISPEMSDYDQTPKKNRQNRIIASNLASLDDAEPIADDAVRKASQTEEISEDTNDRPNESIEPGESDGIREDPTNNEKHNENTNTGETHVKNIEVTDNNKKSSEEADENLAEDTNGVIKTSETDKKDTEITDENNTSLVELDGDDTHDTLDENETLSLHNTIVNPDLRRESEVEIRRLAECIVQRGDGRGPQCSVDSANLNGNDNEFAEVVSFGQKHTSVIVTNPSVDLPPNGSPVNGTVNASPSKSPLGVLREESASGGASVDTLDPPGGATLDPAGENITNKEGVRSNCASPASSNGGIYSTELLENFALNLHRIEKDVQRCDRNYWFFTMDNLDKLRNIMCTYVWEHLDEGYMQGMCDLVAPLLVILGDEAVAHACFTRLMQRALHNFPCGQAMDAHFANMRSLIQILDCEMYELMHAHNDYTHFYFCYRWFLLDFKRELLYKDVFYAWELIWSARDTASEHMVLFVALALLETYRDIILSNSMDFTDIIKFFNEMAEHHDAMAIFSTARELVWQVQTLIENK